jgi:hypothetical protein
MGWRLVVEKLATLTEVETHYSLRDVVKLNDILDALEDARPQPKER